MLASNLRNRQAKFRSLTLVCLSIERNWKHITLISCDYKVYPFIITPSSFNLGVSRGILNLG